jgi:X-X-X-Leu-X-X-Gly heptad repeat protein
VRRTRKSHLWLAGAGAIVALAVSLPMNGAVLADSKATPPTVETTLGSDGSAVSTRVLNSNGADTSKISGSTALKTSIAYSLNGQPANRDQLTGARGPVSVTYKVENTTGKTQDVTYTSADGQQHTQQLLIQVPFVAMVEATVPASYNNVQAPGGAVSVGTDGNLHIIWSLVLFSPIGSPTQEVSFSAQADAPQGLPGVTVTARPINPSATEGLSGGTLTANAAVAQNDLFGTYATGADQGLAQLGSGIGQLVAGLTQLHDGSTALATGLSNPGCNLNNPLNPANPCGIQQGSGALAVGLAQINAGLAQLADPATGLPSAQVGIGQLQAGVSQLLAGVSNPGCNLLAPHNAANPCGLIEGVALANGGLTQIKGGLSNPLCVAASPLNPANPCGLTQGLATIRAGVTTQLLPGLAQIQGGLSNPCNPADPLSSTHPCGLTQGLATIRTGVTEPGGLLPGVVAEINGDLSVKKSLTDISNSPVQAIPGSCGAVTCQAALGQVIAGIGSAGDLSTATLIGGLDLISLGLSNSACNPAIPLNSANPCGVVQGLDLLTAGVGQISGGVGLVQGGLSNPACNPASPLNPPLCGVVQGLDLLTGGVGQISGGVGLVQGGLSNPACNLADPHNLANPCGISQGLSLIKGGLSNPACNPCGVREGLALLANGTTTAVNGVNQLYAGSGQALTGAKNLAAGAPTAASGAQQIRDGLAQALSGAQQAGQGTSAISAQGTAPLITQLQDASNNAHLELATIDAAGARAGGAPLGADATWLYRLDAVGSSNLGRNLALGVGGLLVLLLCGVGGFVFGRRGRAGAVA